MRSHRLKSSRPTWLTRLESLSFLVTALGANPPAAILTIEQPSAPIELGSVCQTSSVTIALRASNTGLAGSAPLPSGIMVTGGRYSGRTELPAIPARSTADVVVRLDVIPNTSATAGNVSLHATIGLAAVGGNAVAPTIIPSVQTAGDCVRSASPAPGRDVIRGSAATTGAVLFPSPPSALSNTLDPVICSRHAGLAGALGCKAGLPLGMLALVWNYCSGCNADGFHLYRVDGGRHELVPTPNNGTGFTAALLDKPAGGFNGRCYAVSAYAAGTESSPSNAYCAAGGSVQTTVTLRASNVRSWVQIHTGNTGALAGLAQASLLGVIPLGSMTNSQGLGVPVAGYVYRTNKSDFGDSFYDLSSRAGVYFDVASLRGRSIASAKLRLKVSRTMSGSKYTTADPNSCAANVGLGKDYWWTYSGPIQNADFAAGTSPGIIVGPDVAIDVTRIVSAWASGSRANYGFVLRNPSENLNAFTEDSCLTNFFDEALEVTYS